MRTHGQAVQDQFDSKAEAYLTSEVHARGPDLERAAALVAESLAPTAQGLDVGCGAGHLSFALAPNLARIVALDPSPKMLSTMGASAAERGLVQIATRQASAESLPFEDASFDLVCSRYSAHHWTGLPAALAQMRRVIKPRGYLLIIDVLGADDPLVDTHLQTLELLRDPSHVRNRSSREWRFLMSAAGFTEFHESEWALRLEFAPWVARMEVPPERVSLIRAFQRAAPSEVRNGLAFEADGSFTVRTGLFWARAA